MENHQGVFNGYFGTQGNVLSMGGAVGSYWQILDGEGSAVRRSTLEDFCTSQRRSLKKKGCDQRSFPFCARVLMGVLLEQRLQAHVIGSVQLKAQ